MSSKVLWLSIIGGLILGVLNSWYWYKKGYRGGKLLFMGVIGFTGILIMILKWALDG